MISIDTFEALAALDPCDLDYHAGRYSSGASLQEAVETAQEKGASKAGRSAVDRILRRALRETRGDGGDPGVIPCLGGDPEKVWKQWKASRP